MPEHDGFDDLGFQRRLAELEAARRRARSILGVPQGADTQHIRAAYRRQAKLCHPDRMRGNPAAHRQFLLIRTAYELLMHGKLSPLLTGEQTLLEPGPNEKYNMDSEWGHFLWWRERSLDAW